MIGRNQRWLKTIWILVTMIFRMATKWVSMVFLKRTRCQKSRRRNAREDKLQTLCIIRTMKCPKLSSKTLKTYSMIMMTEFAAYQTLNPWLCQTQLWKHRPSSFQSNQSKDNAKEFSKRNTETSRACGSRLTQIPSICLKPPCNPKRIPKPAFLVAIWFCLK